MKFPIHSIISSLCLIFFMVFVSLPRSSIVCANKESRRHFDLFKFLGIEKDDVVERDDIRTYSKTGHEVGPRKIESYISGSRILEDDQYDDDDSYSFSYDFSFEETSSPTLGASVYEVSFSITLFDVAASDLDDATLESIKSGLATTLSVGSSQITLVVSEGRRELSDMKYVWYRFLSTSVVLEVTVETYSYSSAVSVQSIMTADGVDSTLVTMFQDAGLSVTYLEISDVEITQVQATTQAPSYYPAANITNGTTVISSVEISASPTTEPVYETKAPIVLETTAENCAFGYEFDAGENPGWRTSTWRGIAYSCEGCASVCDGQDTCVSYQCAVNGARIDCMLHETYPTFTACLKLEDYMTSDTS